jgi:pyruvate/2-oxoglutarate dehydrogenase complex dihydrolipoamide dehydrogenase (E3) component
MNDQQKKRYAIVVIGAGAGGLVIAIGGAKAGKSVLLIENGNYGGDCTNFGCIPSKSTIASAHVAQSIRDSEDVGVKHPDVSIDTKEALQRTRTIVSEIRTHEEPEVLHKHGIETLTGHASFVDAHTLEVKHADGTTTRVTGDHIVLATGSHPRIPNIEGIDTVPVMTNEKIFDLETVPESMIVVGGGPIGCELAQAYHRLGSKVSIVHRHQNILNKEEKCAQAVIEKVFIKEGIDLYTGYQPVSVTNNGESIQLTLRDKQSDQIKVIEATHLLVSSGRIPNLSTLNLDAVGIHATDRGITVDEYGRTNLKNIWAVGDVAGRAIFTHLAENEARAVLTSLLLPGFLKKKLDRTQALPRVTYCDPEIASLGLTEEEAIEKYGASKIATYFVSLEDVDRAITTGRTEGFVKIVTKKWSSKIIGAVIVAPRAGEMLMEISVAMYSGTPLRKLASIIHPYPTYSLAIRKAADQWLTQTILPSLKALVGK